MVFYLPPFRWDKRREWSWDLAPALPAGKTDLWEPFPSRAALCCGEQYGLISILSLSCPFGRTKRDFLNSSLWESGVVTEDKNHKSVGTLLRLKFSVFHSHASSQLSFRNSSKSLFKHSYQFILIASVSSISGK